MKILTYFRRIFRRNIRDVHRYEIKVETQEVAQQEAQEPNTTTLCQVHLLAWVEKKENFAKGVTLVEPFEVEEPFEVDIE